MRGSPYRRLNELEKTQQGQLGGFEALSSPGGGHHDYSTGAHPVYLDVNADSPSMALCRVWENAVSSGSIDYYPSKFNELDVEADTWDEGPLIGDTYDCFLVQRFNFPLTVNTVVGGGCYLSKQDGELKTLTVSNTSYTLPVYVTVDRPTLNANCEVEN